MDAERFNELKNSIRQMKAIERGELAPARVSLVNLNNEWSDPHPFPIRHDTRSFCKVAGHARRHCARLGTGAAPAATQ